MNLIRWKLNNLKIEKNLRKLSSKMIQEIEKVIELQGGKFNQLVMEKHEKIFY